MPAKKTAATKAAPAHPKYDEMIREAIRATGKPVRGASLAAIKKYLEAKYGKALGRNFKTALRLALKRMVAKGQAVQTKGSFRLGKAEKKPRKPKKAKKAKKAKKPKKSKKAKKAKKPKAAKKPRKPKAKKPARKAAKKPSKKAAKKPKKSAGKAKRAAKAATA